MLIKTKILLADPEEPPKKEAQESARILKAGGIVSFPTETVYALGGDAYNQEVVARIYRIKRRDSRFYKPGRTEVDGEVLAWTSDPGI